MKSKSTIYLFFCPLQLFELEHRGGVVSTKEIMSVVGDKMSDQFEEFFRQHGGQSCGEQKSEQAAKGE